MKKSNIYINLWSKNLASINSRLKYCVIEQFIQLDKSSFEIVGNREKSGYQFNLEFTNGSISNSITNSAVARDLAIVLQNSLIAKRILQTGHHKIRMNKEFLLSISRLKE